MYDDCESVGGVLLRELWEFYRRLAAAGGGIVVVLLQMSLTMIIGLQNLLCYVWWYVSLSNGFMWCESKCVMPCYSFFPILTQRVSATTAHCTTANTTLPHTTHRGCHQGALHHHVVVLVWSSLGNALRGARSLSRLNKPGSVK